MPRPVNFDLIFKDRNKRIQISEIQIIQPINTSIEKCLVYFILTKDIHFKYFTNESELKKKETGKSLKLI